MPNIRETLSNKSMDELRALAKKLQLVGFSRLPKEELIKLFADSNQEILRHELFPSCWEKNSGHVYGAISIVGLIVAVLFYFFPRQPSKPERQESPIAGEIVDSQKSDDDVTAPGDGQQAANETQLQLISKAISNHLKAAASEANATIASVDVTYQARAIRIDVRFDGVDESATASRKFSGARTIVAMRQTSFGPTFDETFTILHADTVVNPLEGDPPDAAAIQTIDEAIDTRIRGTFVGQLSARG